MDIDNNHKVNNHPVFSYEMGFFTPNGKKTKTWKEALELQLDDVSNRRYRIGIQSKVYYLNYAWSEERAQQLNDDPSQDHIKNITYRYVLELNDRFEIIGGEWLTPKQDKENENLILARQPDFIWMAPLTQRPYSEMSLSTYRGTWLDRQWQWAWDGESTLPEDWLTAARADLRWSPPEVGQTNSKLKSAQLLSNIVYVLFEKAR